MTGGDADSSTSSSLSSLGSIRVLSSRHGYSTWKFQVRMYLKHENLWKTIEDKSTEREKEDGSAITYVRACKSPKEAWEALSSAYEDKGMGRRLVLERRLYRYSLADFNDVESYNNAIMSTAQDLDKIGKTIEDVSLAAILLGGLTPHYNPLIMAMENSNIVVSTELVKSKLLNEFTRSNSEDGSALSTRYSQIITEKVAV